MDAILPPQASTFLAGHGDAQKMFMDAVESQLHHAWLVEGPAQVGKATFVSHAIRAFFQHQKGGSLFGGPGSKGGLQLFKNWMEDAGPLTLGAYPDVMYVERQRDEDQWRRDITVEQIRGLIHFMTLTSGQGGWKVGVIDSIDQANPSAANALLKILEEPRPRSLLFLISHGAGRVLPTLRSRCRVLRLGALEEKEMHIFSQHFNITPSEKTLKLARGCPGRLLQMTSSGLQDLPLHLETIFLQKKAALPESLLASLLEREREDLWLFFREFFLYFFKEAILKASQPHFPQRNTSHLSGQIERPFYSQRLESALDLWNKLSTVFEESDRLNLDRKSLILTSISSAQSVLELN